MKRERLLAKTGSGQIYGQPFLKLIAVIDRSCAGPGYWLSQTDVKEQLESAHPVIDGEALSLPDLQCPAKYCIGTDVDRDWAITNDGHHVYEGYCQGKRAGDEMNGTCMELVGLVGMDESTMSCVEPPFFCAANHTGRLCATCVEGTRKIWDGSCCISQPLIWSDFVPLATPIVWAFMIFYAAISVSAADAVLVALTFCLQTMKLVGLENDWLHGFPFMRTFLLFMAEKFSMEPPKTDHNPCEPASCPYFAWSTLGQLYWACFGEVALIFFVVIVCFTIWRRLDARQRGMNWEDAKAARKKEGRDKWRVLHRSALGVYVQAFMPVTDAALDIVIPRLYDNNWGEGGTGEREWLLKADPAVPFLGTWSHMIAFGLSMLILLFMVGVLPLYIMVYSADEVQALQTKYKQMAEIATLLDKGLKKSAHEEHDDNNDGQLSKDELRYYRL